METETRQYDLNATKNWSNWVRDHWAIILTTIAVIGVAFSLAGQLAFWSVFDVDVLRYIEVGDVVKNGFSTALVFPAQLLLFAMVLRENILSKEFMKASDLRQVCGALLIVGFGCAISRHVFDNKFSQGTRAILDVLFFTFTTTSSLFTALPFIHHGIQKQLVVRRVYVFIIAVFAVALNSIVCYRLRAAHELLDDPFADVVKSIRSEDTATDRRVVGLKYLGTLRDRIFLLDKNNSDVVILNTGKIFEVEIGSYKNTSIYSSSMIVVSTGSTLLNAMRLKTDSLR